LIDGSGSGDNMRDFMLDTLDLKYDKMISGKDGFDILD